MEPLTGGSRRRAKSLVRLPRLDEPEVSRPPSIGAIRLMDHASGHEADQRRHVVTLRDEGTHLVSRSEAKHVLEGVERFREVILDFHGVEGVGQGFADEVFRVWAQRYPEVRLRPERMAPLVEFMVRRALRAAGKPWASRFQSPLRVPTLGR